MKSWNKIIKNWNTKIKKPNVNKISQNNKNKNIKT